MYRTAVYTRVNDDMQRATHLKPQKSWPVSYAAACQYQHAAQVISPPFIIFATAAVAAAAAATTTFDCF